MTGMSISQHGTRFTRDVSRKLTEKQPGEQRRQQSPNRTKVRQSLGRSQLSRWDMCVLPRTLRCLYPLFPTRPDRLTTPTDVGVVARGARIPDDFTITDQMRAWAAERCPGVDIDLATEKFVNYWQARPGKNGTKLDWFATWRNWLLSDFERLSAQRGPLPPKVTAAERAFALTQKFRKEENNEDFPNVRVVDGHGSD